MNWHAKRAPLSDHGRDTNTAELTRVREGEEFSGKERVFVEMALEVQRRDPQRHKALVCLIDGERALWELQKEWLGRAIGILDLFHVLELVVGHRLLLPCRRERRGGKFRDPSPADALGRESGLRDRWLETPARPTWPARRETTDRDGHDSLL
jgi:hypothetical protein